MKKIKRQKQISILLIVIGLMGCVGVFYVNYNNPVNLAKRQGVDTSSGPSSAKLSKQFIKNYSVLPTYPKYLEIPKINIKDAPIVALGLTKNNAIGVPNNIYEAGWFKGSALPGNVGAIFIYAHLSSWISNGLFYNLKDLKIGDEVEIVRGDNRIYKYQVVARKIYAYDKVDMGSVLSTYAGNIKGLNLMTCAGHVIKGTSEFDQRLVVFTKEIQ